MRRASEFTESSPRLTKKTNATVKIICDAIKLGLTRKDACIASSISEDTLQRWLKSDAVFADKVSKSELQCKQRNLIMVQRAAQKPQHWQASAWMLERKFSEEFALKQKTEHTIDPALVKNLIANILVAVKKQAPDFCPHCNAHLDLPQKIAREMESLSASLAQAPA